LATLAEYFFNLAQDQKND